MGHMAGAPCARAKACSYTPTPALAPTLQPMIRWMIVIFLALLLISWFTPLLHKLGFGRLPGDFRFKLFGREWSIPLATTIILSLVASAIARLL